VGSRSEVRIVELKINVETLNITSLKTVPSLKFPTPHSPFPIPHSPFPTPYLLKVLTVRTWGGVASGGYKNSTWTTRLSPGGIDNVTKGSPCCPRRCTK
jgi:hypothetical protein